MILKVGTASPPSKSHFGQQWNKLETNQNPFAMVIMAHLKAQETFRDKQQRKAWKLNLTKQLYERGYQPDDVIKLFRFIDWVMKLPKDLSRAFWQEMNEYERERSMPYITSVERIGIEKGLNQGREEGRQEGRQEEVVRLLLKFLQGKFKAVPTDIQIHLQKLSVDKLEELIDKTLVANSLEEFMERLAEIEGV
jgi:flagellar biosynthesis/type III secretory pathway protein FliH